MTEQLSPCSREDARVVDVIAPTRPTSAVLPFCDSRACCSEKTAVRPIFAIADRLVQIWLENERELENLRRLRLRQRRIRAYAASPGSNAILVATQLQRIDSGMRKACARLGANDRETRTLLARLRRNRLTWGKDRNPRIQTGTLRRRSG